VGGNASPSVLLAVQSGKFLAPTNSAGWLGRPNAVNGTPHFDVSPREAYTTEGEQIFCVDVEFAYGNGLNKVG
jgi:hypothetical protein